MKLRNIILGIASIGLLAGCNDYLDVEAPSGYENEFVYGTVSEMNKALNGVYASILDDNTFGRRLYNEYMLNSDVDFAANSNEQPQSDAPRRFDMTTDAGSAEKLWNQLYATIETANNFVYNAEHGEAYDPASEDFDNVTQMIGEAKVIRAMAIYELLCYYGDVPFTFEPTYQTNDFFPAVVGRDTIYTRVIEDLKTAAPLMKSVTSLSDGVERVSKEACWAMIARMALQAGGYSLRPDGDTYGKMERPANYRQFYQIARDYADSVIVSRTHALNKSYKDVFIDECNFTVTSNDDPIFEIPFAQGSTGQWGYYQGPQAVSTDGATPHVYGEENGGVRTEAFYRYTFDEKDLRRDFVNGLFYYASTGSPTMRVDYSVHNNKWAKLWNKTGMGSTSTGNTGINFAYLRYADVLLMFAEAENELNGPTADAQNALRQVRNRAFAPEDRGDKVDAYVASAASSKEDFLTAVLNERKWEFAGENMRWKDLVRNNLYNKVLFNTYLRYLAVAENGESTSAYMDKVEEADGIKWSEILPYTVYWCYINNPADGKLFTNTSLPIIFMFNAYKADHKPQISPVYWFATQSLPYTAITQRDITGLTSSSASLDWQESDFYGWWDANNGVATNQVLYSLYGYIRGAANGDILLVRNGQAEKIDPLSYNTDNLPVVRYLFPFPNEAISRSGNKYQQHYGY